MDPDELKTWISLGRPLLELGNGLAELIKQAVDSSDVQDSVVLYLETAQAAVEALGIERQRILTDARRCNVSDPDQVNALWERLDRYLYEDNIRPQLEKAINGLGGCSAAVMNQAQGLRWRKNDKEAAVETFQVTLRDLESTLQGLVSNFYPGYSGMGVQTLVPIYELLGGIRDSSELGHVVDFEAAYEELGELVQKALRDSSHEDWFRMGGKVETLIAELHLAF